MTVCEKNNYLSQILHISQLLSTVHVFSQSVSKIVTRTTKAGCQLKSQKWSQRWQPKPIHCPPGIRERGWKRRRRELVRCASLSWAVSENWCPCVIYHTSSTFTETMSRATGRHKERTTRPVLFNSFFPCTFSNWNPLPSWRTTSTIPGSTPVQSEQLQTGVLPHRLPESHAVFKFYWTATSQAQAACSKATEPTMLAVNNNNKKCQHTHKIKLIN